MGHVQGFNVKAVLESGPVTEVKSEEGAGSFCYFYAIRVLSERLGRHMRGVEDLGDWKGIDF